MNGTSAIENKPAQPAATHHVDEQWTQATLDDMGSQSEEDGATAVLRRHEAINHRSDVLPLQNARKQRAQGATRPPVVHIDEVGHRDFVRSLMDRQSMHALQRLEVFWTQIHATLLWPLSAAHGYCVGLITPASLAGVLRTADDLPPVWRGPLAVRSTNYSARQYCQ